MAHHITLGTFPSQHAPFFVKLINQFIMYSTVNRTIALSCDVTLHCTLLYPSDPQRHLDTWLHVRNSSLCCACEPRHINVRFIQDRNIRLETNIVCLTALRQHATLRRCTTACRSAVCNTNEEAAWRRHDTTTRYQNSSPVSLMSSGECALVLTSLALIK